MSKEKERERERERERNTCYHRGYILVGKERQSANKQIDVVGQGADKCCEEK